MTSGSHRERGLKREPCGNHSALARTRSADTVVKKPGLARRTRAGFLGGLIPWRNATLPRFRIAQVIDAIDIGQSLSVRVHDFVSGV